MKKFITLLAFMGGSLFAANTSLTAGSGSATFANTSPWTTQSQFFIQARIHGSWNCSTSQNIYNTHAFYIQIQSGCSIVFKSWFDTGGSGSVGVNVSAGTDVIISACRDATTTDTLYIWLTNTQTGASLGNESTPMTPGSANDGGQAFTVGGLSAGSLAYVRTYTSCPSGYATTAPVPGNTYNGNQDDWELESNGTDQTGSVNLTMSGATYAATPLYSPAAVINPWPTISSFAIPSGGSGLITMNGSSSFTASDNATLSYAWSQLSGPGTGTITNATSANSTFSTSVDTTFCASSTPSDYVIQLIVTSTDGTTATTVTQDVGAVIKNTDGSVKTCESAIQDKILGKLVPIGAMPWPYFDLAEYSTAQSILNAALASGATPTLGSQLSGTVTVTQSPVCLTGTGTHFTTEMTLDDNYIVTWNSSDGSGTGRMVINIDQINSDTNACDTGVNSYQMPSGDVTNVNIYNAPATTSTFELTWWQQNQFNYMWNFYGLDIAGYRMFFRTGLNIFLTQARSIADLWWQWALDHGYSFAYQPRDMSIVGQFFRAADGESGRYPGLYAELSYLINNLGYLPPACPNCDTRESGYTEWGIADGAMLDPDSTRHSQYCSWLQTDVPLWVGQQTAEGYWPENVFQGNQGYEYAALNWPGSPTGSNLVYGASPWRMNILMGSLEASYYALNNPSDSTCYAASTAATILPAIANGVNFEYTYGRDTNVSDGVGAYKGITYDAQYQGNAQLGCSQTGPSCNGTVSVNSGSTSLVGVSTNLNTVSGGAGFIGFQHSTAGGNSIYKITSCSSDTACTISPSYGSFGESGNLSGANWYWAPAYTGCPANAYATYCPNGDRNLTRLAIGPAAWMYEQTGNSTYSTIAYFWAASSFGGPAVGPNANARVGSIDSTDACGGPMCDGFITEVISSLPNCGVSPCTVGGDPYGASWKDFSEAFGAPDADEFAAVLLQSATPATGGVSPAGMVNAAGVIKH